jgi:hypothetical protein
VRRRFGPVLLKGGHGRSVPRNERPRCRRHPDSRVGRVRRACPDDVTGAWGRSPLCTPVQRMSSPASHVVSRVGKNCQYAVFAGQYDPRRRARSQGSV